jgi:hypothetical protein
MASACQLAIEGGEDGWHREADAQPRSGVAPEDSATGVTAARVSGVFLVTVPSQPGKRLDGDYVTPRLVDPILTDWRSRSPPAHDRNMHESNMEGYR